MNQNLSFHYGKVLKEIRIKKDITQEDVREEMKIDVSNYERGERLPRLDTLHCLAWFYQVPVKEIVNQVEKNL